jgi:hypothetical protein
VSLLWRDTARISLAPHRVALARISGGLRNRVADRKVMAMGATDETGQPRSNWAGAVNTLREALTEMNVAGRSGARADATLVLSNHFVRYLIMPWSAQLVKPAEELIYAQMRFQEIFGDAAGDWAVSLSPAPAGAPRIAAAVDRELIGELRMALSGSKLNLVSVQPALMSQFNAWRREIGDDAWLVLAERGRVLIAWISAGQWRSVRARPISGEAVPLAQWIEQEKLLLEADAAPTRVCLGVADEVSIETDAIQSMGLQLHRLTPRARAGFAPRADVALYLAMAGAA